MSSTRYKFEIIVVVDGFLDRTYQEALKLSRKEIKVMGYEKNKGKGYAIRYGMAKSKGDLVAFIDAGMDINANGISMILEHMQWYKADIIVASKRHPASQTNYPAFRKLYSIGYQLIVFILFHLKVRDTQTGLKVFKRDVLENVLPRLVIKQYAFDVELLAVAHYVGYTRIYEAPVQINWKQAGSNFDKFLFLDPLIRKVFWDTLAVFYRMHVVGYYSQRNRKKWVKDPNLRIAPRQV